VLSPLLSHQPLHLALGAAAFTALGWALWRWEMQVSHRAPAGTPDAAALEPTDRM